METEETRDVIRRFVEARASNDAATIDALLTDDAVWAAPKSVDIGPFEGRETVVTARTGGAAGKLLDLDTVKRDVRSIIVDGDRNAVALLFAGGDQGGANGQGLTYGNAIQAVFDALKVQLA